MDSLTLFGLFAVTAMLVFYALEHRNAWFILAFGGACALGSAYGFLQGAWPFGLVEAVWSLVAVRRWWQKKAAKNISTSLPAASQHQGQQEPPSNGQLGISEKAQGIILETIRTKGKAQRHDLLPKVGLSKSSLGRLLDQMEAKGLIRQEGERKASYYVLLTPK